MFFLQMTSRVWVQVNFCELLVDFRKVPVPGVKSHRYAVLGVEPQVYVIHPDAADAIAKRPCCRRLANALAGHGKWFNFVVENVQQLHVSSPRSSAINSSSPRFPSFTNAKNGYA
jgi:hypothetical protein